MRKFLAAAADISRTLSRLMIGGLLAASLLGLTLYIFGHEQVLSVQTASMVPTFRPGDAVLERHVPPAHLRPGDIISYRNPRAPMMVITHRLISQNTTTRQLTTRGDNALAADPAFPAQAVLGRVTAVAPGLGGVLDYLHTPVGLIIAVYTPGALVISMEVRRLLRHLGSQPYRVANY